MSDVAHIDTDALDAYFRAHVSGYRGPLRAEKFARRLGASGGETIVQLLGGKGVQLHY